MGEITLRQRLLDLAEKEGPPQDPEDVMEARGWEPPAPLNLRNMFSTQPDPLDYVLPGMVAGTVGLIVGAGSSGKSMLSVQIGMSIAAGADIFRLFGGATEIKSGRVVYLCAEDQETVLHHRLYGMAAFIRENLPDTAEQVLDRISERLDILPLYGRGVVFEPRPVAWRASPWWRIAHDCEGARLIIVDTLIRFAGGASENDNVAMSQMMSHVEATVRATGASIVLLHHVGKAAARDGSAGGDQTAVRGASALTDNARWQANLQTMTPAEAEKRGIADVEERRRWVSFESTKTNYGPADGTAWLQRGDNGVLRRMEPPERLDRRGGQNGAGRL